jgi:hypothetical protein
MFPLDVENELLYNSSTLMDNSTNGDPLMAKLEELVTPTELLSAIKEGAIKQELVKKYRASEQELAMMLLPLYRRGDLTKEEFNAFFKGASLKKDENAPEAVLPKTEDEPPSEILKSLSKIFGKKSQEEKQPAEEEAPPPSQVPEAEVVEETVPEVAEEVVTEPTPEITSEAAAHPTPDSAPQSEPETVPEEAPGAFDERGSDEEFLTAEELASLSPAGEPSAEAEPEVEAEVIEEHAEEGFSGMDSASISDLLNSIFAKLNSIDTRLAVIEKKVLGE